MRLRFENETTLQKTEKTQTRIKRDKLKITLFSLKSFILENNKTISYISELVTKINC